MELTILMPCLNEALTLATCINKAKTFLETNNIDGEMLLVNMLLWETQMILMIFLT